MMGFGLIIPLLLISGIAYALGWIGIVGFTFLSLFTIIATFIPALYQVALYFLGSIGGILALSWFALVARRFFQLASH